MGIIGSLLGSAGTALLQRTYLIKTDTPFGIPQPLVVFDAVTQETPEYTADVTQHPVESGPEVTDHIQLKNPTLKISGTISNSPLDLSVSIGNLLAGGIDVITSSQARANILNTGLQQAAGIAGASLLGGSGIQGAAGGAFGGAADAIARTVLLTAFETKSIFDVVTKRQKFEDMVIQSLSFPRDASTGFQVMFELEMVRIRIVSPLSVQLGSLAENIVTAGAGKTNLGAQATAGVTSQTSGAVGGSWLRSIVKGV